MKRSELNCPAISVYVIGTDPPIIDRIISSYNHGSEVLQDFVKKKVGNTTAARVLKEVRTSIVQSVIPSADGSMRKTKALVVYRRGGGSRRTP